jgi:hypothetical protein
MSNTLTFLFEYENYISNIENSDKDDYIYKEILKRTKFDRLAIIEGLIFTHPNKKSADILKRRFPELTIEIEEDGELYIENHPPQKIINYLPLITNLGYFVSKFTIDGHEWNYILSESDEPLAFYLEPKYDYQVEPPKTLFHASPARLKHKILKHGLTPKSGNKLSKHPDRIYLTDSINKAIQFGDYLIKVQNNEWYENGYCIYSVDTINIHKLFSDVNLRQGGFYTTENIKPMNINLLKEVKSLAI